LLTIATAVFEVVQVAALVTSVVLPLANTTVADATFVSPTISDVALDMVTITLPAGGCGVGTDGVGAGCAAATANALVGDSGVDDELHAANPNSRATTTAWRMRPPETGWASSKGTVKS
jgi:hypothetical protein